MRDFERPLKALANRRRLSILQLLKREREATVGDIAASIRLSFRSTSRHLAILAAADIVGREQRGVEVFYHLARDQHSIVRSIITLLS